MENTMTKGLQGLLEELKTLATPKGIEGVTEKLKEFGESKVTERTIAKTKKLNLMMLEKELHDIFEVVYDEFVKGISDKEITIDDFLNEVNVITSSLQVGLKMHEDLIKNIKRVALHAETVSKYLSPSFIASTIETTVFSLMENALDEIEIEEDEEGTLEKVDGEKEELLNNFAKEIGAEDPEEIMSFIHNNQKSAEESLKALGIEPTLGIVVSSVLSRFNDKYKFKIDFSENASSCKELDTLTLAYDEKLKEFVIANIGVESILKKLSK